MKISREEIKGIWVDGYFDYCESLAHDIEGKVRRFDELRKLFWQIEEKISLLEDAAKVGCIDAFPNRELRHFEFVELVEKQREEALRKFPQREEYKQLSKQRDEVWSEIVFLWDFYVFAAKKCSFSLANNKFSLYKTSELKEIGGIGELEKQIRENFKDERFEWWEFAEEIYNDEKTRLRAQYRRRLSFDANARERFLKEQEEMEFYVLEMIVRGEAYCDLYSKETNWKDVIKELAALAIYREIAGNEIENNSKQNITFEDKAELLHRWGLMANLQAAGLPEYKIGEIISNITGCSVGSGRNLYRRKMGLNGKKR